MIGKYHISDVIDPSDHNRFKQGYINLIRAFPGGGKTYFALEKLPNYAKSRNHMLYLTDTNMNRAQILATYNDACGYSKSWREFANTHKFPKLTYGFGVWENPIKWSDKIVVMNYAQVAALIYYGHAFDWSVFDYVIADELHNLIHYKNIKPKDSKKSILELTIQKIKDTLKNHPKVIIIGMTATPTAVYKNFPKVHNVLTEQEIEDIYHYEIFNCLYYKDPIKVLNAIPKGNKGIIYFSRIEQIKKAEDFLKRRGHRTGSFWSVNSEKTMTQDQINVRQHIIDFQEVPPDVDILLINASAETGINIFNNDITFMVIHAPDGSDTLIQARGRLRHDLNNLHFYNPKAIENPNPVPAEYLNRFIPTDEMARLCEEEIRYMKPNKNEPYKTGKTIEYLNNNGYRVKSMKYKGNRGYYIELI